MKIHVLPKCIIMSKVFETNALKGKSLASGMKARIAELQKYGVKESDLTQMEQDADKAIEAIREGWPPCVSWGRKGSDSKAGGKSEGGFQWPVCGPWWWRLCSWQMAPEGWCAGPRNMKTEFSYEPMREYGIHNARRNRKIHTTYKNPWISRFLSTDFLFIGCDNLNTAILFYQFILR